MYIEKEGLDLIKHFEQGPNGGFASEAYVCPAGYWTIGWGHKIVAGEKFKHALSKEEAEHLLASDLVSAMCGVEKYVKVPITQGQYDALVSFAFNLGVGAMSKSTLLKKLNEGDYEGAADEFKRWIFSGGVALNGLRRRREMERKLFLSTESPNDEIDDNAVA